MYVLHSPFHSSPKHFLTGTLCFIVTVSPWLVLLWLIWPHQ